MRTSSSFSVVANFALMIAIVGVVAFSACGTKTEDNAKAPATQPSSASEPARTPTVPSVQTVQGITLPGACKSFHEDGEVGPEGASVDYEYYWCAETVQKVETVINAALDPQVFAAYKRGSLRWERADHGQSFALGAIDDRRFARLRPPKEAKSILQISTRHAPPPCPPCVDGDPGLPGCSCP